MATEGVNEYATARRRLYGDEHRACVLRCIPVRLEKEKKKKKELSKKSREEEPKLSGRGVERVVEPLQGDGKGDI